MTKPSAIIFDLDGTLLDTEELILTSLRYATRTVLGASPPDDELRDMIGIPLSYQMHKLSAERADELFAVYQENNQRVHDSLNRVFPGVEETLARLKAKDYRLAVVTSKRTPQAKHGLEMFKLDGYFEFIQGADETKLHKPNPEPLFFAADRLNLAVDMCAYVGDSPYDMLSARAAGMLAIAALWGIFPRERLIEAGAQKEASLITELPKLFA